MSINFADDFDYMIIERFYDERVLNTLKGVYNAKIINLEESDIVMRMIGEDLSKENIKEQIDDYLKFKRHYVGVVGRWD